MQKNFVKDVVFVNNFLFLLSALIEEFEGLRISESILGIEKLNILFTCKKRACVFQNTFFLVIN